MKIIVFIVTALIQLAVAAISFFMLLLGLNGFTEKQSTPSLILYILLGLTSAVGLGVASAYMARRLVEKQTLGSFGASAVAIIGSSIVGAIVLFIGFIVAVLLASMMRGWK
ncbi:MAG TPA: hypothetical protein VF666_14315 [Pyrinomonadaceae bacterium]